MKKRRSSGILAHITSLPSPYGIGDIGNASYAFIDFLRKTRQTYWQFLPINPTSMFFDDSPYMSNSAFAGSSLLISPDLLESVGLITAAEKNNHPQFSIYLTDYRAVRSYKEHLLRLAFSRFNARLFPDYEEFCKSAWWLDDYALFMTAKEIYNQNGWFSWPESLARREPAALANLQEKYSESVEYYCFEQFIFHRQWSLLRQYANLNEIKLFGDLPIYVAHDSVDVWANIAIFSISEKTLQPVFVSGVPPDYFSKTGQKWGNPLYNWNVEDNNIKEQLQEWWIRRFRHAFSLVDTLRIDHFRGFDSYWSIPAENETAIDGKWLPGPGKSFFDHIASQLGELDIVAEDLGIITESVEKLRDDLQFPGMKVLQFAFDGNLENSFLPHNFTTTNCVVYTGTHDNDTTVGWFLGPSLNDKQRSAIKKYANRDPCDNFPIHLNMIYLAHSSIARLAILPLQDILGFGNDCRMNTPGISGGNWRWRCSPDFLTENVISLVEESTTRFTRTYEFAEEHAIKPKNTPNNETKG